MPLIRVEFFGLARAVVGVEAVDVDAETIGQATSQLALRFPKLAAGCFRDGRPAPGWLFNINGHAFTSDISDALAEGDTLLLLPADAGG